MRIAPRYFWVMFSLVFPVISGISKTISFEDTTASGLTEGPGQSSIPRAGAS